VSKPNLSVDNVLDQLTTLFRDILDDDSIVLGRSSTTDDVEDWDSVSHISLMLATEEAFGVRFNAAEVGELADVGELVDLIRRRLGSQ